MLMGTTTSSAAPKAGLRRELGLTSTIATVIGGIIAVGIFLTPAGMAKALGSPFWLLMVWLVVGTMTLSGALCYGEFAGRFPRAGGGYVYLHESFGPRVAFLYGWMCLLVMDPAVAAAFASGVGSYAAYIVHLSPVAIKIAAIGLIWSICLLNVFSIRVSAGVLRWITWLKLGSLAFLTVWAIVFRLGSWSNFTPFVAQRAGSLPLAPALGVGAIGAFFSFAGWWEVTNIAGEVRDPARTVPRALAIGVPAVTAVYIVVSAVFFYLVPLEKVTSDQTFVAQAGEVLFGRAGAVIFAAIVIVCLLGSLAALIISAPRVYYAMARDGLFLKTVAQIHPRFGTPANAIAIQGFVASLLVLVGSFEQIISYTLFVAILFLGITVAGLFVVRARRHAEQSVVLTPVYPFTPIVFLLLVVLMLFLVGSRTPLGAALGVLVVLAGLPVYEIFRSRLTRLANAEQTE
jgi:APA family basic amino acid/polyamine antiporter